MKFLINIIRNLKIAYDKFFPELLQFAAEKLRQVSTE